MSGWIPWLVTVGAVAGWMTEAARLRTVNAAYRRAVLDACTARSQLETVTHERAEWRLRARLLADVLREHGGQERVWRQCACGAELVREDQPHGDGLHLHDVAGCVEVD